jgi:hypothetical protein
VGQFSHSTCIGDEQTRIITIKKNFQGDIKEIERALFRENKHTHTRREVNQMSRGFYD